jgi:hypothetical protein
MRHIGFYLFLLFLMSCKQADDKAQKPVYIDLETYFKSEVERLSKKKSLVNKTIRQNGTTESKNKIEIDWLNELSLFISSDINKPAWKDSYTITQNTGQLSYYAKDPNLRTREIQVNKDPKGNFKRIFIKNINKNYLYESTEVLVYIPDSIYSIEKKQNVILLGKNSLFIEAEIIK